MNAVPDPASTTEALAMIRAGIGLLAATDPTAVATQAQAECLQALEQFDSISTAVRAWFLAAFTNGQGYTADADYNAAAWLIHRTKVTRGAARGHVGWSRRTQTHPLVLAALAEGTVITESIARILCRWTDKLPEACRDTADEILVTAARRGVSEEGLAGLAAEIYARSLPEGEDDPEQAFEDRKVTVATTFGGAGVISGALTPECAAIVGAVLESLSAPAGAEDTRSREQRYHDALQEAMRRLAASDLLPERAGHPVKMWAHVSLAELRALAGSSVLEIGWVTEMRVRWSARRAQAADGMGSDGGAWLDGAGARAAACDAVITPVVTGDLDPAILDDLVALCVQLAGLGPHRATHSAPQPEPEAGSAPAGAADPAGPVAGQPDPGPPVGLALLAATPQYAIRQAIAEMTAGPQPAAAPADPPAAPAGLSAMSADALRQAIIGKAVDLLSGPGGLASFLRTNQLGARLAGPSLPLDVGSADTIPAGIRHAVILRDQHCRWAGGCTQPAAACEVHHVRHKAHGGPTSTKDCVLLCSFHHQVVIHRWGWTLVLNPDGTTTAWNPDRTKTLHSHGPPARAG